MPLDMEKFAAAVAAQKKSGKTIAQIENDKDAETEARMKNIANDPAIKKLFAEADAETEADAKGGNDE